MTRTAAAGVVTALLFGCPLWGARAAAAATPCVPTAASLAPDARVPPGVTFGDTKTTDGADETAVRFRSGDGTIGGVIVRPHAGARAAKRAGIVWVHWLGDAPTTNHTEFLPDARALAARGATSLAVDAMWSAPDWFEKVRSPDRDACDALAQVRAIRRAIDVLLAQADVDPKRVAYVGHDFGAMYGALALAVDPRPAAAVYMTPTLTFWEWFLLGAPPANEAAYHTALAPFDLPPWLARGRIRPTLLQFGKRDFYVSPATAIAFRNALPAASRTYKMYDAEHALADVAATSDRRSWLAQQLALEDPLDGKP